MLGFKGNEIVADLGAGTGFYAVAAAKMVPHGKVYAVELHKDFLITIKNKAKEMHVPNVECLWGDIEKIGGTKIGNHVVDVIIASNVFSQLPDKEKFLDETIRILKQGGRILLVDWSDSLAFSSALRSQHIVTKSKAQEMLEKKGFVHEKDINAGAHHYGMIFINNNIQK